MASAEEVAHRYTSEDTALNNPRLPSLPADQVFGHAKDRHWTSDIDPRKFFPFRDILEAKIIDDNIALKPRCSFR